jgi:hypothetical protein
MIPSVFYRGDFYAEKFIAKIMDPEEDLSMLYVERVNIISALSKRVYVE